MQLSLHRRARHVARIWTVTAALTLGLALAVVMVLWHWRADALDGQTRELNLLSLALSDEVDRGLKGAEAGIVALQKEILDGRLQPGTAHVDVSLRTRADLMPLVSELMLLDKDFRLLAQSAPMAVPSPSAFYPKLNDVAGGGLSISRPFMNPQSKEWMLALAARYGGAHDANGGWILAAIPAPKLLGAFSAASPASDARMAIYRLDGVLLSGTIVASTWVDEAQVAEHLNHPWDIELRQFRDGTKRLISHKALPKYGLHVLLTRDFNAVMLGWERAEWIGSLGFIAVALILVVASYFVARSDRRKQSAQQALQAQIARATKLESLGTLSGVVAHDFNNLLAAITGFGEMALDAAPADSTQARHIGRVLAAAERGKAMVERILAFSGAGARISVVFELEKVIQEVLGLLSVTLTPGIVIEQQLNAQGARVRGDPTQMFDALLNLCTNARHAMPSGGLLSVSTSRLRTREPRLLSHSQLEPGDYLVVSIADQGLGMTADVMEHLFEPFFTTRGDQEGTGLGLAVVHGAVAEFNGAIDVRSTPGHGSCFALYIPECQDAVLETVAPERAPVEGTGQRILVIDDEPDLVEMVCDMLTAMGYAPTGFDDPQLALQALRADTTHYAAVVSDEAMPGMTGTQLSRAIATLAPGLPVILVSGYGGMLLAQRARHAGIVQILAKPLRRQDLALALSDVLA